MSDSKKVSLHPAYWRALSDFSYSLLCMCAFVPSEDMRKELMSVHDCIHHIHEAYGIDEPNVK